MPTPSTVDSSLRLGLVFTGEAAQAAGVSRRSQSARVASGRWLRLRRGVFCLAETWEAADEDRRHLLTCAAAQNRWPAAVVSHLSAAAAWGWPTPIGGAGVPWLTSPSAWTPGLVESVGDQAAGRVPARRRADVRLEVASLPSRDVVRSSRTGLTITSGPRTAADCLRHLGHADAVPVVDAAAAAGVSKVDVCEVLTRQERWPYAERARVAMRLIDPRRESWLESVAAVEFDRSALPRPECQARILDQKDRFVARVDYLWLELGVISEIDGWAKYRLRGLRTADDAERLLKEEKEREDRLRDLGHELFRANAREVLTSGVMRSRFERARERADPGRIRGRVVLTPWPRNWPAP